MQVNEQIAAIIGKKLEGQASAEELEQLQLWLSSGEGNSHEYDLLVKIWDESPRVLSRPAFNTEAAWTKVDAQIGADYANKANGAARVIPLPLRRAVAVAAVIIVVAAGGWLWNKNNHRWHRFEAVAANQSIQLPDGSVVELRKGSRLEYPPVFNAAQREVRLEGEAFFSVQQNEHQPFQINTLHARVEVLGTSFLVRSEDARDEVVVATGAVSVTDKGQSLNRVVLKAGQKVVLEQDHFKEDRVMDSNYLAWKTGVLEFKATPLAVALSDIARFYNTPLSLAEGQEAASKTALTVRFENESFESVLEELKQVTGLQVKKENGKTFLYQK